MNKGIVKQIIGPVVDLEFKEKIPQIYNAVEIKKEDGGKLVLEVQQHLGGNLVRAVAMGATDGLRRHAVAADTGAPISVPVGKETLGRVFNLLGEPVDGLAEVKTKKQYPIHYVSCKVIKPEGKLEHIA